MHLPILFREPDDGQQPGAVLRALFILLQPKFIRVQRNPPKLRLPQAPKSDGGTRSQRAFRKQGRA